MNEPQAGGRGRGRAKKAKAEELVAEPHADDEPAHGGDDAPVELDVGLEHQLARQNAGPDDRGQHGEDLDFHPGERPVEWDYDEEAELEADYDEEFEFEPDYDEDVEFDAGHGPQPRLAPGPKHGPGDHPGPPHEHGPGPKKAPGKKVPGKKASGPKKHPGHPPPPPHEHGPGHRPPPPHGHGPGHGEGEAVPESDFGLGPGTGFGFGPGPDFGLGFGFDSGRRGRRRGPGAGRRGRPGEVRAAILTLLAERPMHGYEMIQEIAERTHDLWRPSPGSVYPALQLLGDEGLIIGSESQGSQKLFELSDDGRTAAEKIKTPPWEKIAEGVDSGQANLRAVLGQLVGAVAQSAYATTAETQQRILAILKKARREIYTLLADSD